MNIINIDNNFKEEIKNGTVIVDFWATWCGPCKMFGPVFENTSKKFKNVKFCKLNVDSDKENICKDLGVMSIPTIILFKDGIEIKRNVGFMNDDSLVDFIGDN